VPVAGDGLVPLGPFAPRSGTLFVQSAAKSRVISLFRRSGLLDQVCRQTARGKAAKARMSSRASSRWAAARGELGLQRGDDVGVAGADRGRAWRVEDGADQGRYPRLGGLGHLW
jgi:hypothetical protein